MYHTSCTCMMLKRKENGGPLMTTFLQCATSVPLHCVLCNNHTKTTFLTTAQLIKSSQITERLEMASFSLSCSFTIKLLHHHIYTAVTAATWFLICCVPQWSQRLNNLTLYMSEPSWPFKDLTIHKEHILLLSLALD